MSSGSGKVLIIAPRKGGEFTQYHGIMPNGGVHAIASYAKGYGYDVDIDTAATVDSLPMEAIRRGDYLAVGISAMTCKYPAAVELMQAIKEWNPMVPVGIGGIHVSALEPENRSDLVVEKYSFRMKSGFHVLPPGRRISAEAIYDGFDFIILGLGGQSFVETLRTYGATGLTAGLENVPGLIFRAGDWIVRTPDRPYPRPQKGLNVFPKDYELDQSLPAATIRLICSSTKCQGRCSYCYSTKAHKYILLRSLESFMREWESIPRTLKMSDAIVFIVDDSYLIDLEARKEQLRFMAKNPRWFIIQARARDFFNQKLLREAKQKGPLTRKVLLRCIDYELMGLLRDAGLWMACLGAESPNEDNLEQVGKDQELEMVRVVCDVLRKQVGSLVMYMTMIFPTDGRDTYVRILQEAERYADALQVHLLTPIIGTPYLEEIREHLIFEDYALMDGMHAVTEIPGGASAYDQQMALLQISDAFYAGKFRALWHSLIYRRPRPADVQWIKTRGNFWTQLKFRAWYRFTPLLFCFRQKGIARKWKEENKDFLELLKRDYNRQP